MRKTLLIGCWVCLLLLGFSVTVAAQDFTTLIKAVDKIEANLKALIEKESTNRSSEIATLRSEIKVVDGGSKDGSLITRLNHIEKQLAVLRSEIGKFKTGENGSSLSGLNDEALNVLVTDIQSLKADQRKLRDNVQQNHMLVSTDQPDNGNNSSSYAKQLIERMELLNNRLESVITDHNESKSEFQAFENISFSGFVDASNYTDHNAGATSFGLDQVEVDVSREFEGKALLQADIEFVSDGAGGFGLDLEQGYLNYQIGNRQTWSFTFGKFNAPIGFELLDAPDMYQYSHAIVFDNGLPTNLTGLMVSTTFPAVVDWSVYIVNGWDVNADNNKDKTFGTRVGFTVIENLNFGTSFIYGAEQDDNNSSHRAVFDFDLTYNPVEIWTIGGEINIGTESEIMPDGSSGQWNGFLIMNNVALGDRFGMTTRFDYFNDKDGLRTGSVHKWKSFCISPSISIVDGLGGLVEIRYDWSDTDFFMGSDGTPKDNQVSTALEFTYGF